MLGRFERFILDITEIDLYWHRIAGSVAKPLGLKGSYAIYFTRLHDCPEGMTAAELAAACCKDKADVSRDIGTLEKAGLLERIRVGDSGYRAMIRLTEQGEKVTESIISKAEAAVNLVGQDYTEQEREIFYRVLNTITNNLRELSRSGFAGGEQGGQ